MGKGGETKMEVYTPEQVKKHATVEDAWVIYKGDVFNVTEFLDDHPGGSEVIEEYLGESIEAAFDDVGHSESATEILEGYKIGVLSTKEMAPVAAKTSQKRVAGTIDETKGLLKQLAFGDLVGEDYVRWTHTPRHFKDSPRLFDSDALEMFTKTQWWVIPLVWLPMVAYTAHLSFQYGMSTLMAPIVFVLGFILWTLDEYTLHRFLFHMDPGESNLQCFIHFLFHGIHHYAPMDHLRLVFPPVGASPIMYFFWNLYSFLTGPANGAMLFSGGLLGYIVYDLNHYYLHHGKMFNSHLAEMKKYHMAHHFKNHNMGFGITHKGWDRLFGTVLQYDEESEQAARKTQ